nr:beta-carotene hydroxylase 2, chloroplastic-like [Ipomoea batatas]
MEVALKKGGEETLEERKGCSEVHLAGSCSHRGPQVKCCAEFRIHWGEEDLKQSSVLSSGRKPSLTVCFVLEDEKLESRVEIRAEEIEKAIEKQISASRLAKKLANSAIGALHLSRRRRDVELLLHRLYNFYSIDYREADISFYSIDYTALRVRLLSIRLLRLMANSILFFFRSAGLIIEHVEAAGFRHRRVPWTKERHGLEKL